jgi:hypothetical protein
MSIIHTLGTSHEPGGDATKGGRVVGAATGAGVGIGRPPTIVNCKIVVAITFAPLKPVSTIRFGPFILRSGTTL